MSYREEYKLVCSFLKKLCDARDSDKSRLSYDPKIWEIDDDGWLYNYNGTDSIIEIPDGVEEICTLNVNDIISQIFIPSSVQTIQASAFYKSENLTNVVIAEGLDSIGNAAFYDCSKLSSINIPSTVKNIGISVFYGCSNLK